MNAEQLNNLLERYGREYDAACCLLGRVEEKKVYHSVLETGYRHSLRDSAEYAQALFQQGEPTGMERAKDILERLMQLQDTDRDSQTFGLWPYYLEEPLAAMAPPDWNWADFIGKIFLRILISHRPLLEDGFALRMLQTCENACACIMRRNCGVQYTNVCLMDCYMTIVMGQMTSNTAYTQYGTDKLQLFWAYTMAMGGLQEFNSPTYTLLVAHELTFMKTDIKSPELLALVEKIDDLVWRDIAEHFYLPEKQWSGPHARAYTNLMAGNVAADLEEATGVPLAAAKAALDLHNNSNGLKCPDKYLHYFKEFSEIYIQRMNYRGSNYPWFAQAQIATTYNTEKFSLASFNNSELWNQIRPLIGYFGGKCLRVRLLHDFYDFSSGQLHCVQHYGSILGCINISVDRGDTHIGLDLTGGKIKARDMRVRFQLEGAVDNVVIKQEQEGVFLRDGGVQTYITMPYCVFGTQHVQLEVQRDGNMVCVDAVWYSGAEREFILEELEEAVCLFGLSVSEQESAYTPVSYRIERGTMKARWAPDGSELEVWAGTTPQIWTTQTLNNKQYINGKPLEELAPPQWV